MLHSCINNLILVGMNNCYGYPNKEVLENLKNSKIYKTDEMILLCLKCCQFPKISKIKLLNEKIMIDSICNCKVKVNSDFSTELILKERKLDIEKV